MRQIVKRFAVTGTEKVEYLACPSQIELIVTDKDMERLAGLVNMGVPAFGERLFFNLGHFDVYNDEGEKMELDWRPDVAVVAMYGSCAVEELKCLTITVGCRDDDGEYFHGNLELTQEEIDGLLLPRECFLADLQGEQYSFLQNDTDIVSNSVQNFPD